LALEKAKEKRLALEKRRLALEKAKEKRRL
jgi:hypothetical protein